MLKLIKYLKKYKLETWLSPLFKLIEAKASEGLKL